MSKTLFWHIFWNLLRVFVLTTLSLSAIMSFAVLLRPLTENGLDFAQVNRLLLYSMPAVCAYSLPVAALFATTVVYGRFSADNELTAMRACGISYLSARRFSVALPALVLGLLVAVISLLLLSFVVPVYSLKVEEVVYSNIARVIAHKIEREHSVEFPGADGRFIDLYADGATVAPPDPDHPSLQKVELTGPAMIDFVARAEHTDYSVPREFLMAAKALITINRTQALEPADLYVRLYDGMKFPRIFYGNVQVGIGSTGFGPIKIPVIDENVKFLNITRLAELAENPEKSQRVKNIVDLLNIDEQIRTYLAKIGRAFNNRAADGTSSFHFSGGTAEADTIEIGGQNATAQWDAGGLMITAENPANERKIWLMQMHGSQTTLYAQCREMHVRVHPDPTTNRMQVTLDLFNVAIQTQDAQSVRGSFPVDFSIPMPEDIAALTHKSLGSLLNDPVGTGAESPTDMGPVKLNILQNYELRHEQLWANNAARSELHGRASFALSCLSLVMVGCALGVMFKSGNFLNAFAASFVPALLCITLIICGQQAATHMPFTSDLDVAAREIPNPLHLGLWFIWIGNLFVLLGAVFLTVRLQRR
jgi:lipopolysaccharide export LptBFGC system permease protein LptF